MKWTDLLFATGVLPFFFIAGQPALAVEPAASVLVAYQACGTTKKRPNPHETPDQRRLMEDFKRLCGELPLMHGDFAKEFLRYLIERERILEEVDRALEEYDRQMGTGEDGRDQMEREMARAQAHLDAEQQRMQAEMERAGAELEAENGRMNEEMAGAQQNLELENERMEQEMRRAQEELELARKEFSRIREEREKHKKEKEKDGDGISEN